ncbi:LANO_0E11606g1_1 [Lachancea nothofagi CBS 11611]|uniref:LANO_0E11606g1_1 n=1 Tax=Lachancea nothofagi CBS 11611 TaxID=1266666 RepID=A0A1G4JXN4_9SACH|nr:LANO_0E11606g1_1 [Lachancea nothofagi CBS 11611]
MRPNLVVNASVSRTTFTSRRSFEKLDTMPSTVFQYYFQLQLKELHHNSPQSEITDFVNKNNSFKRYKRKEWDSLSLTKKRVYHALYFHFTKVNYRRLGHEELARRLELQVPAASEYLLFRNRFKARFDAAWEEQRKNDRTGRSHKIQLRSGTSGSLKVSRIFAMRPAELEFNSTRRFQDMCRECRRAWREGVDDDQRAEIATKLSVERQKFENSVKRELDILDGLQAMLTKYLTSVDVSNLKALDFERRITHTSNQDPLVFLMTDLKKS